MFCATVSGTRLQTSIISHYFYVHALGSTQLHENITSPAIEHPSCTTSHNQKSRLSLVCEQCRMSRELNKLTHKLPTYAIFIGTYSKVCSEILVCGSFEPRGQSWETLFIGLHFPNTFTSIQLSQGFSACVFRRVTHAFASECVTLTSNWHAGFTC